MLAACGGGGGAGGGSIPAGGSGPSSGGAVRPSVVEHGTGAQIIEFPITTGATVAEAPIIQSGGALWFLDSLGIGKVTTAGKFSQYAIGNSINALVSGSDGNVWFGGDNYLGHVLPNGTVQEFQIAGASPCIEGLASTPKDKTGVWFTDYCENMIGRVPTDATDGSTVVEYATTYGADSMTSGPDGNLWFTEPYENAIGKSTTAGSITEYPLGQSGVTLTGIGLTSAGGALWFPAYISGWETTGGVASFSLTGVVQHIESPSPWNHNVPFAVTTGPDGNVWWLTGGPLVLDSATPSGTLVSTNIPLGVDQGYGLTVGPDKNFWFTDMTNNSIDVYIVNPQTVTPTSIAFNMVGETQTFSASEGGSGTSLTVTSSNAKVASVAPAATLGSWTVTAVGAGTCNIKVADQNGNYTDIAVSVTTESFVVQ